MGIMDGNEDTGGLETQLGLSQITVAAILLQHKPVNRSLEMEKLRL